jgi:site-specific DNA recombinase
MIQNIRTCVTYARVSTEEQKEQGFSLDHQKVALQQYCKVHDIDILHHYEEDYSGKNFDRPQFKMLFEFVKKEQKKIDAIIFTRWDRFSRNLEESLRYRRIFLSMGIEVMSIDLSIDSNVPETKIMFALMNSVSEVERDKIGLRTKEGMRKASKLGYWTNRPPRGYINVRIHDNKPSLSFSQEAPMVREIFEMYSKGCYSVGEVRHEFRKRGFKGSKQGFINLLKNIAYTGRILIREDKQKNEPETFVDGLFDPIIDIETWERCQRILKGAQWNQNPDLKRNEDFPLRGHLKCRKCGANLTASFSGRENRKFGYYHCLKGCPERFRADFAHQMLVKFLKSLTIQSEVIEAFSLVIRDVYEDQEKDKLREIERFRQNIDRVKTKITSVEDRFFENQIDLETYKMAKQRYNLEIEELEVKLTELTKVSDNFLEYLTQSFSILEHLDQYWDKGSSEDRRKLLSILFPEKLVFENNQYRTHPDNLFISAMVNKIKGFERGEIKKDDISVVLASLAPRPGLEP